MPNFNSPEGDLERIFIDDYAMIDQFAGTGSLWLWGFNSYGLLGDNTTTARLSPVQTVSGGTNWKQVDGGYTHTAAIKTDGTLWLWGTNAAGQLGNSTVLGRSSPVQTVSGGTNWKQVSCGYTHTAAIKTDGTLWSWGTGTLGRLGDNTLTSKSSPVQTIAGGTNWELVSCGGYHSFAVKTDGTLWGWGYNATGQLGDNTIAAKSSPIQTIASGTNWKQVACGQKHTAAIKTDGTLWSWGENTYGRLGDNTVIHKSSPVQTIAGGTNWKQVDAGSTITAAIKTDGTLWSWGYNTPGSLGDNTVIHKSSPVQTIAGGTNWKQVACGSQHIAAIKTDGALWTWGYNITGQLGDNTNTHKSSPIQTIAGGTNWKQVAGGVQQTAAVKFYDAGNL